MRVNKRTNFRRNSALSQQIPWNSLKRKDKRERERDRDREVGRTALSWKQTHVRYPRYRVHNASNGMEKYFPQRLWKRLQTTTLHATKCTGYTRALLHRSINARGENECVRALTLAAIKRSRVIANS